MAESKGRHRRNNIPPDEKQARHEAVQQAREADELLQQAQARISEVRNLTAALRRIRERNHFGELVRGALEGGSGR